MGSGANMITITATPDLSAITGLVNSTVYNFDLNDLFTTNRAAGSVNGTSAEPGPGTRAVTDTGSKLSISSDQCQILGKGTWDDPKLVYDEPVTRAPGVMLVGKSTIPGNNSLVAFTDAGKDHAGRECGANSKYIVGSGSEIVDAGWPVTGTISYVFALRAAGQFAFLKTAANYKLIYVSTTGSTGTLYVMSEQFTNALTLQHDFLRIPTTLWLPTPLISHGADSAVSPSDGEGHAEGATGLGGGGDGVTLTQQGATWSVAGGKLVNTPTEGANLVTNPEFTTDTSDWASAQNAVLTRKDFTAAPDIDPTGGDDDFGLEVAHSAGGAAAIAQSSVILSAGSWFRGQIQKYSPSANVGVNIARHFLFDGSFGYPTGFQSGFTTVEDTWEQATGTGRINNANIIIRCIANNNEAADVAYFDKYCIFPLTLNTLFLTASLSTANVYAQTDLVVTAGTQAGLVIALDSAASPANFMVAYHDGTNCVLDKNVAGTYTNVVSAAAAYSANAPIVVTKDGTAVRLYYNNALVGSGTVSDAGIVDNTIHGLFSTYSGNTIDDVVMYARGTGGEYDSVLDIYTQVA